MKRQFALSLNDAKYIISAAETEVAAKGMSAVVAVIDHSGTLVGLHRMDGVQVGSVCVAERKARTALQFKRPTSDFQKQLNEGRFEILSLSDVILPVEGGVPIVLDDEVLGAVGISGMLPSEDGRVAQMSIERFLGDFQRRLDDWITSGDV